MKYPKPLKKGDTIGLVCPASGISPQRARECIRVIKELGYRAKAATHLTMNDRGYMAGPEKLRGREINEMFEDSEVDAIFCVRGGYSSGRVLEFLDLDRIRAHPKMFLGYSDVTSLHLALNQRCGLVTFHGPMVSSNMVESFDQETRESLFRAASFWDSLLFQNPRGFALSVMKEGRARGLLTGGNLSLLCASLGTPYEVDTRGKILFIEEVGESVSRIDRMTFQLRQSGKLRECAAILLGQFTDCENKGELSYGPVACFRDILEGIKIPVMYGLESGHGFPMMTLPLGGVCVVDTREKKIVFQRCEKDG